MANHSLIDTLNELGFGLGDIITIHREMAFKLMRQLKIDELLPQAPDQYLFLKLEKMLRVSSDNITYARAYESYTEVLITEESFLLSFNLRVFMERVAVLGVIRVHRSYAIYPRKLKGVTGNKLIVADLEVPISKSYRRRLRDIINIL